MHGTNMKISEASSKFRIFAKFCYNAYIKKEEIVWQMRLLKIARKYEVFVEEIGRSRPLDRSISRYQVK